MKRKLIILLGVMTVLLIIGSIIIKLSTSNLDTASTQGEDQLKVITTFYPVYMVGINLAEGIDNVEVKSLTDLKTGCLHDYQLTTEDMKIISEADVMVINGGGMEGFLNDIMANYPDLTIINASEGIDMLPEEETLLGEKTVSSESKTVDNQNQTGWNAHVWLDPQLYIKQIENITNGLKAYINTSDGIDPSISELLSHNSQEYINKIKELDQSITQLSEEWKKNTDMTGREAVIFHDSFAYLAKRIGITVAHAVPLDSDTSLSAGEISEIVDEVKAGNIHYLFTEQQFSDSIANRIATETGASVFIIDSAVTGDGMKDSYLEAMRRNVETLKTLIK